METIKIAGNARVLIAEIERKQRQEGLSDYQFAAKMGIGRPLWQLTRTGRCGVGLTLIMAVYRTFPELRIYIHEFLGGDSATNEKS